MQISPAPPEFGAQVPTRVAADVEYRGHSGGHDYLVRARHRFLDAAATVVIDGVEHDPTAEEAALKTAETSDAAGEAGEAVEAGERAAPADGLQFRCEEGFASLRIRVRRPDSGGQLADAEVIVVRTTGLGGAGEAHVERGFGRVLLVPADGSPSAAREERRTEHPTRYALVTALGKSARYLLPLLGLGALLSGLLDPVIEWAEARLRPTVESVAAILRPIRDWFSELVRPAREVVASLLRPVAEALRWLRELLFGWIPDVSLPFSVPEWVVDVAIPLLLVLLVFVGTFRELRQRGRKLATSRAAAEAREAEGAGTTTETTKGATKETASETDELGSAG